MLSNREAETLRKDAKLANDLIAILLPHVAERGYEDDPRDVLKRIIAERDSGAFAQVNQSAAIFAFLGWMTGRPTPITIGSGHDCSEPASLINEFADSQQFAHPIDGWDKALKPYPVSKDFYQTILKPRTTAAIEEAGPIERYSFADVVALLAPRPHLYILDDLEGEMVAVEWCLSGGVIAEVLIAMTRPLAKRLETLTWNFCARRLADLTHTPESFLVKDGNVLVPVMTMSGLTEVRLVLRPIVEAGTTFAAGDVVQGRDGPDQKYTVREMLANGFVECDWFEGANACNGIFKASDLEVVP